MLGEQLNYSLMLNDNPMQCSTSITSKCHICTYEFKLGTIVVKFYVIAKFTTNRVCALYSMRFYSNFCLTNSEEAPESLV